MSVFDLFTSGTTAKSGASQSENLQGLTNAGLRYLRLLVEDARLGAAEKLTVLLSTLAFYAIGAMMAMAVLVFLSIGVGHLLADTVAPKMAYIYVACFYVLLFVLVVIFRRQIFLNPIARLITRLLVAPPVPQAPATSATEPDQQS